MSKHYAICENMCLIETYSKDEIDKMIITVKVPYHLPRNSGDEVISVFYPNGFNKDNCIVVGLAYKLSNEGIIKTVPLEINNSTSTKYIPFCDLLSNTMEVGMFITNILSPYGVQYDMDIFVTLQKTNIIDGIIQE